MVRPLSTGQDVWGSKPVGDSGSYYSVSSIRYDGSEFFLVMKSQQLRFHLSNYYTEMKVDDKKT